MKNWDRRHGLATLIPIQGTPSLDGAGETSGRAEILDPAESNGAPALKINEKVQMR